MSGPKLDRKVAREERMRRTISTRFQHWKKAHAKDTFIPSKVPFVLKGPKVGRNDPCPCGQTIDGKPVKFKHCCGG
jgi:uncharacterized protein YecA (UPF0149 family)